MRIQGTIAKARINRIQSNAINQSIIVATLCQCNLFVRKMPTPEK